MPATHFVLFGALEYAVMGYRGARLYRFQKGVPLEVRVPQDITKFRRQTDLFHECDAEGNPVDPAAVAGPAPRPRSFRSFRPPAAMRASPPRNPESVLPAAAQAKAKPPVQAAVEPPAQGEPEPPATTEGNDKRRSEQRGRRRERSAASSTPGDVADSTGDAPSPRDPETPSE